MVRPVLLLAALFLSCASAIAAPHPRNPRAVADARAAFAEMIRAAEAYGNAIDALAESASTFCISERAEAAVAAASVEARARILDGFALAAALSPGLAPVTPTTADYAAAAVDLRDLARWLAESADLLGLIGDEIGEAAGDDPLPGACRAQSV